MWETTNVFAIIVSD